jgi:hypothetical protein
MKKLMFLTALAILIVPMGRFLRAQDVGFGGGDSIDVTGVLNGGRGGGGRGGFNRAAPVIPDSKSMMSDIKSALNKGKTPLEKAQEMPLQSLLDTELVGLSDRIQVLQANRNQNRGGDFPDRQQGAADSAGATGNNSQLNALEIQVETLTILKNDDFLDNKLSAFLTPDQVALVRKAKSEDKTNATCLGGLLDRATSLAQASGRGNNNNFNNRRNNNSNNRGNNSADLKSNGQPYCMTSDSTAADRLEPIRKVLANGSLPLAPDKETIAEVFMKSQIKDLEDAMRAGITSSFNGNRGGNNANNRNNNPQLVVQTTTDNIYKKVAAMLTPPQVESLKRSRYKELLDRGGAETLIGVEFMQDTPLNDEQIARVTAAWPEFQNQIQASAKASNKKLSAKELDSATTAKVLEMLEPAQAASFEAAQKYNPDAASRK